MKMFDSLRIQVKRFDTKHGTKIWLKANQRAAFVKHFDKMDMDKKAVVIAREALALMKGYLSAIKHKPLCARSTKNDINNYKQGSSVKNLGFC